jgi:hypothetical protein
VIVGVDEARRELNLAIRDLMGKRGGGGKAQQGGASAGRGRAFKTRQPDKKGKGGLQRAAQGKSGKSGRNQVAKQRNKRKR